MIPSKLLTSTEDRSFQIAANVDIASVLSPKNIQYNWRSVSNCSSGEVASLIDFSDGTNFAVFPICNVLKFSTNALRAGAIYCIQVRIIDGSVRTNYSEVQFKVLNRPSNGICTSSNTSVAEFSLNEIMIKMSIFMRVIMFE